MEGILYKYRALSEKKSDEISDIDKVIDILENNRLFFPNRNQLNDPLEGVIKPMQYSTLGSSYFIENGILQPEFRNILNEYKVLSFSRNSNSMQMWAHYANNYCGVCIGFDLNSIDDELKRVKYTKRKFKPINIDREEKSESEEAEIAYNNFLYKSYFWKYEDEVRIIKKTFDTHYMLPENVIKNVIFGNVLEINSTYIERIASICEEKNIKMYRVVIAVDSFDIKIEPFDIESYRNGDYNPYVSKGVIVAEGKHYPVNSYYTEDGFHVIEISDALWECIKR